MIWLHTRMKETKKYDWMECFLSFIYLFLAGFGLRRDGCDSDMFCAWISKEMRSLICVPCTNSNTFLLLFAFMIVLPTTIM